MSNAKQSKAKIVKRTRTQVYKHWIKALRSGKYKQTKEQLRDTGGMCCLGVLCDLATKDGGHGEWKKQGLDFTYKFEAEEEHGNLPNTIYEWIRPKGNKAARATFYDLAEYNDNGKSFKEIADIIETKILPYVKD